MTLINSRMVRGRCPCGAEHAACGPPSTSTPALEQLEVAVVGGPLKRYTVVSASGVETVMKLNEADARFHGVAEEPAAPEPSAEPQNPPAKKRAVGNKSRTAAGKGGAGGGDD